MERQAESVQKFLSPCEHLILVEEEDPDFSFWFETLDKYYTNHKLTLKSYSSDVKNVKDGWRRQQVLKLLASRECSDKYLILDSKDFFIRPTNIQDWDDYQGSNLVEPIDNNVNSWFTKSSNKFAQYFSMPLLEEFFVIITPFVMDTKYFLKHEIIVNKEYVVRMMNDYPGEFLFYSYMAQDLIANFKKHPFKGCKVWPGHSNLAKKRIVEAEKDPNIKVFGIHFNVIPYLTTQEKLALNAFIKSVGLTVTI